MINSKIYYLCKLLQKTEIGKYSKVILNFVELFSDDNDIVDKLKGLKFMENFKIIVYHSNPEQNFNILRIYQKETAEEFAIEDIVEKEFNKIFNQYKDKIDFIYCIDKTSFIIESDNLDLIREINLSLKNFEYIYVDGYKHLFKCKVI